MRPEDRAPEELSWHDQPLSELTRLAWPIAVSTVSYAIMTLMDTIFVGWLGPAQLAGVGFGGTAAFFLLCFSFGLLRGAKTLISQAVGAGQPREVGAYIGAAVVAALGLGTLTVGIGAFVAELLPLLSASPESGEAARSYFSVRVLGSPLVLGAAALRQARYGQSDAHSPMVASVAANVLNVVLDYVFLVHLQWGVAWAAWSTLMAHGLEAAFLLRAQASQGFAFGALRVRHLLSVWRIGYPTGLQFLLEMGSFAVLAAMLAKLSEVEMAAHQIALQVIHFSFLPAFAVAEAASIMVGQAVGARRDELVLPLAKMAVAMGAVYTGVCSLAFALFAPQIVSGFTDDPGLARAATSLLYVAAVFQVFDGGYVVARGVLRGTADVRFPAIVGVTLAWVMTPPMTWLLGYELGWGALGGWLGLCAEIILGAIVLWVRLARGGWKASAQRSRARLEQDDAGRSELAPAGG